MRLNKFYFDKKFLIAILTIAVPLMLQQLIVSSVNLVDNLMVSKLGDIDLGGVTAVNKFYMIANFATFGMAAAGSVFMAQYYGAENKERLKESFRFMVISTLILNLFFACVGFFFPRSVLSYFTSNEEVILSGVKYLVIIVFTFIPMSITISITNGMRSLGESKIPLIIATSVVLINTFLNYCLIFGNFNFPKLGVEGAAYATLIARVFELIFNIIAVKINRFDFSTRIIDIFKIEGFLAKNILIKAIPLCINEILWSSGMATIFKFYSTRGLEIMSGSSVSGTIADIFFTLFGGMAITTTVFVSQKLGANKIDEAKGNAYKLMGVCFFLSWFFALGMFSSSFLIPIIYSGISTEAQRVAINMVRIQSLMYWIYMITTECYFILRAGGDTKGTLLMDSGFMWGLNIPLLALVTYFTNFNYLSIYLIGQSTDIIKLILSYHLLSKEKWAVNLTQIEN